MEVVLIAAVARNGVIGHKGGLVFYLPGDLPRFKAITMGKPIIMGRKTWESLPKKPLPGRKNVVLTRQPGWQAAGATVAASPDEALALLEGEPEVFIIGGAEIYARFLPYATRLELTEVHADPEGDAYFPPFDLTEWQETARVEGPENDPPFCYATYARR